MGQRWAFASRVSNAARTLGASRCSSHARPRVSAVSHAWAVPSTRSTAGAESRHRQTRRLKPLRISSFSQFGLGCIGNSVEQGVDCREAAGWRGLAAGWTGGDGVGALALSATGGGDGPGDGLGLAGGDGLRGGETGRAAWRARVWQYVEIPGGARK